MSKNSVQEPTARKNKFENLFLIVSDCRHFGSFWAKHNDQPVPPSIQTSLAPDFTQPVVIRRANCCVFKPNSIASSNLVMPVVLIISGVIPCFFAVWIAFSVSEWLA